MNAFRFFATAALLLVSTRGHAGMPSEPTTADLQSCDTQFQYKGKVINPMLINNFSGYESDTGIPITTSVDIAAAYQTNQYFDDNVTYDKDHKHATYTEKTTDPTDKTPPIYYGYTWLGRLSNGAQVLEYVSGGGGGTMISKTLFFVRCSLGKGWRPAGDQYPKLLKESSKDIDKSYTRLLLTIERYYFIGDRVAADYALKGNTVTVTFPTEKKSITRTINAE